MEQIDLLSWTPIEARDEGMARTLAVNVVWKVSALAAIESLPAGWEGIGEDIRAHVSARVGQPHSPNCWGALVMAAVRRGLLKGTGRLDHMTSAKSHGRKSEILVRV